MQVFDDRVHAGLGCSILTVLGHGHQKNLHETYECRIYRRDPDDGQRGCPKHVEFYNRINLDY
jgi:hypothetical protein